MNFIALSVFQFVGLLPLELLVFETASSEHSQVLANVVAEYEIFPRKCDALTGLAALLTSHAEYLRDGWSEAFKNSDQPYRDLFLAGETEDGSEPITLLITSVQGFLDYLQARTVVTNVAQVSDYSWQAVAATIDEIETLLSGADATTVSIFDIMESTGNQGAIETVEATIASVRESISNRDEILLEVRLGELDGHFKREIPDSLDVELGINFSDGD